MLTINDVAMERVFVKRSQTIPSKNPLRVSFVIRKNPFARRITSEGIGTKLSLGVDNKCVVSQHNWSLNLVGITPTPGITKP